MIRILTALALLAVPALARADGCTPPIAAFDTALIDGHGLSRPFEATAGVATHRIGDRLYAAGTPGMDTILGGSQDDDLNGGGGSDYIFGGRGTNRLNGGNDGTAGDIMFGANEGHAIFEMGPCDYANGLLSPDSLYVIHTAGPSSYIDNPAFINRFDPTNGDRIVIDGGGAWRLLRPVLCEAGAATCEEGALIGAHFAAAPGIRFFVRMEPTRTFRPADLGAFVATFFLQ